MSIIIGCESFLALRNVRNGDLGTRLREQTGQPIKVLVDPAQLAGSRLAAPQNVEIEPLIEFEPQADPTLGALVDVAYRTRKSYYDPKTFWSRLQYSVCRDYETSSWKRPLALWRARLSMWKFAWDGRRGLSPARRQAVMAALRRHPVAAEYQRRLQKWDAQLVAGFSLEGSREMALLEAAHSLGVPVAVMIRSRDNLAAKIQHLPDAAAYLVWSDLTREFLLRLYPEVSAEHVQVTGSPQFDRHLNPAYRLEREAFFRLIGLDASRPLIVYTTATPKLIDHETEIVQHLADAVAEGKIRRGSQRAQLLVRGHPRGFGSDHVLLREARPDVSVFPRPGSAPYRSETQERELVRLILEDEPVHLATLAYQDVQVNVSGTMTVDSAIFDKPIVNVYYDIVPNLPLGLSVRRFYQRTDYQPILQSGGVQLARSPQECLDHINAYLANPAADQAGRKWIRETDCGPLDGRAGERIAKVLAKLCAAAKPSVRLAASASALP